MKKKLYILITLILCLFIQTQQLCYSQKPEIQFVNQQSETVNFPIDTIETKNGEIIVKGPDGQTETFPGGKDTVITDSTGKSYYVDAEGNVSGPFDQADGGKPTPENTDGVDKNGEVTALTAEGIKVTFEKINNETQYAFDLVTYGKELTKDYKKVDGLFVPFKAVPNGLTDKLLARVNISNDAVNADSLFFKTQNGVKVDAVRMQNSNNYVLTIKGAQKFAVEEVQATIKQGDKYKIAGVFNLVHVSPRTVKLKLVPTASNMNVTDKVAEVKAIYNQLALNVDIEVTEPFDISSHLVNGKVPTEDEFGDLTTYSPAQKAIISAFTKERTPEKAYYIFVTNATSSTGQGGYMALGNQFGFVFNQSARTIAHEFGHGALRLEHPFKQYKNKGLNKGDTQGIMDYAEGTDLLFTDWKQINNPAFKIYAFQSQSDGQIDLKENEYLGFSPSGKIIKSGPTNYFSRNNNSYFITGFSDGQTNGSKYEWIPETEIYFNKTTGEKFDPGNKIITGKVAIWQKSSRPDCFSLYKFIQVTNYTKANFQQIKNTIDKDDGKNWNPDSVHNPSSDCGKEAERIKNEGISPPKVGSEGDNGSANASPEYIKNQLKGLKGKFGGNVEFSKNGKVYRQNSQGEVEEVENPLASDDINNGKWEDSDEEKFRLTSDEKGVIQIEAFGINDKNFTIATGKTANLVTVSNNIRQQTNAFYKEYGVKDLNSTPAQMGVNLNQGQENNEFADGDKIELNNNANFGQIMSEGYTAVKVLLKDAKVEDKIYLDNKKKDVALHAPGLVTGTIEAGTTVVTDITSIGVMVYDLSTDKKVRQEAYDGMVKLKDEIGKDPQKMVPIFIDVITESATGITPADWQKLNNEQTDKGERSHLGSRAVVTSVKTVIAGSAFISKLPKITDDVVEKVKDVKKIINALKRFDIAGEFAKGKNLVENTIEWGGKNFKLKWQKVGNKITFGDRNDLANILGTTDNIEAHHITPWKVCEKDDIVQLAALDGFHPNLVENGIGLEKYTKLIGDGLHGNHPAYDAYVSNQLDKFKKSYNNITPEQANKFLQETLIPDLKKKITAAGQTDMNLNQYFKTTVNPGVVPNY